MISKINILAFSVFYCFVLLSCTNSKNNEDNLDYIYIEFLNLPKEKDSLIHKKLSYTYNNSPFVSYTTKYDLIYKEIKIDSLSKSKSLLIKEDTIILKLRHSFNKFNKYVLSRGDSAQIIYKNNLPRIEVKNKKHYKHDFNINEIFKKYTSKSIIHKDTVKINIIKKILKKNNVKEITRINKKNQEILDSLSKKNLISQQIKNFYSKEIYYKNIYIDSFNEILYDSLVKHSNDLYIDSYKSILLKYVKNKIKPSFINHAGGYKFNSKKAFDFVFEDTIINKKSKEYLQWYYLKRIGNDFNIIDYKERFNKYKTFAEPNLLSDLIKQPFNKYSDIKLKVDDLYLLDSNNINHNFSDILKNNLGKIIYIDFWASWCIPCLKELPFSKKLIKEYKDEENIVFIFISIDKNKENWQDSSMKNGLISYKNSYLALNYPNSSFFSKINLTSIPRYVLIDEKNNILNMNAPNPSSKEINRELNKFLNKL